MANISICSSEPTAGPRMDYEETIDRFRKGSLEIDCRSMTLTQRIDNGEMYRGKGYIRQAERRARI